MKGIIIQDEITVTQKFIDETIKHYEEMPDTFSMGILCGSYDKWGIIKEIKKLSDVGKMIIRMRLSFLEWKDKEGKKYDRKS